MKFYLTRTRTYALLQCNSEIKNNKNNSSNNNTAARPQVYVCVCVFVAGRDIFSLPAKSQIKVSGGVLLSESESTKNCSPLLVLFLRPILLLFVRVFLLYQLLLPYSTRSTSLKT